MGESTITLRSSLRAVAVCISCFLAGIIFGFAMEKGRVFEPRAIRGQMIFRMWIMMKMFLAAMGTSSLVFGLLSLLPIDFVQRHFKAAVADYESTVKTKNVLSVAVGALILGMGMVLSGACPGMVLPQVGAWATMAIVTLAGALLGSFVYLLLHDHVILKVFPDEKLTLPVSVPDKLGIRYAWMAFGVGGALAIAVLILELVVPWKDDVLMLNNQFKSGSAQSFVQEFAWPPFACGIIIGLLQLVIVFVVDDTLGGSSSYATVVSQVARIKPIGDTFPAMKKRIGGLGNWWQVFYVCGGIIGGLISAALSNSLNYAPGVPWYWALIGGFMLAFGARLASGCTSGHGLSGAGLMMTTSFVAVPCMFAGAIGLGLIMWGTGELDYYVHW